VLKWNVMNVERLKQELSTRAHLRISDQYFPGCVIGVVFKNGDRLIVPVGTRHSPGAFGRTGFTGTCVFCDPMNEIGVVILSNGVYPNRDRAIKEGLRDLFRAEIIDIVLQHLGK